MRGVVIAASWIIWLVIVANADWSSTSQKTDSSSSYGTEIEASTQADAEGSSSTSEEPLVNSSNADTTDLFDGDAAVNDVLVSYNAVNSDESISEGEFHIYSHHGKEHTEQGICYDHNGFEVVVTATSASGTTVNIQGYQSNKTNDETKEEASKWIKALYPETSDDAIDAAWDEMLGSLTQSVTIENDTFEKMNLNASMSSDRIQYLTVTRD